MIDSHHQEPRVVQGEARYRDAQKVTVVGAVVNIVLSVIKILAGWLGSSHALIADSIHSLSDPATVVLGLVLILVALGIGYDAVRRLFEPASLMLPGMLALWAGIVSVLAKEALYN